MTETLLKIRGLKTVFKYEAGEAAAIDGLDLQVKEGETLGLVGESGCGKTVTALSIMRLVPSPPGEIVGGEILFNGVDLLRIPESQMRRIRGNDISMIFQEPMTSLNPVFRIEDQIGEVFRVHRNMNKSEAAQAAVAMLKKVGIPAPEEPTTALDVTIQAQILELMNEIKRSVGTGIILITHDLGVVAEMADRVAVMYTGMVVEEAPVRELYASPLHPYTRGLLASIPRLDEADSDSSRRLHAITGMVPDLRDLPPGCTFQDRCPEAQPQCKTPPLLETKSPGHLVRCWMR